MHKLNVRLLEGKDAYLISTNQTVLVVDRNFVLEHGRRPRADELASEPIHEFVSVEIGDQFPNLKSMGNVPFGTVVMTGDGSFLRFGADVWVDIESRSQVIERHHGITVVRVGYHND